MSNYYAELKQNEAVESVEFVGGGIARITLKANYRTPHWTGYSEEAPQFICAPTQDIARKFMSQVRETHMVRHCLTGEMVREDVGTPWCCSVQSESLFCH